MIDTVIFDLDGTLLNTLDDLSDSVNFALASYHLPRREKAEIRRFLGNGIQSLVAQSIPNGTTSNLFDKVFATFKSHYEIHCYDKTRPYDGITELLSVLQERNYKMAIVSNKIHNVVSELNQRFFSKYINIAIGESEGVKRKPSPDTVFSALEKLKSDTANTIYIGDSEVDYQTAVNANIPCISALWGFRDKDFLEQHGAHIFANTPHALLSLLPHF